MGIAKPLFLKVAPFSNPADMDDFLAAVAAATFVCGFSVNLPPGKPAGLAASAAELERMPGAVSGSPAEAKANETIRALYRRINRNRYQIIGSGGVFNAEDAYRKIRLGASLVQLMTALIYEGTGIVKSITQGLSRLVERDGFRSVAEAVGIDAAE